MPDLAAPAGTTVQPSGADLHHVVVNPDPQACREFLARRAESALYHRTEWDRVFSVYRLAVIRLAAMRGGRIEGMVPMVWQRSRLFGSRLVSLPWFDSTGVMADNAGARQALLSAAAEYARGRRIPVLLLRQSEPVPEWSAARTDKVLMRLGLEGDSESLWKRLSPKVRNQVRKAQKAALVTEVGQAELVSEFYRVYSANMRDLGSPAHSERFFQAVIDAFADSAQIYVVRLQGVAIGAGLTMTNGPFLEIPWASSLQGYNAYCVNHLMYWTILERACRSGYQWFHFGRSTVDSGTYHFKKQWGAEPRPLYWYHLDPEAGQFSDPERTEEGFGLAKRVWQQLPLWLTRKLGPRVVAKVS